MADDNREDGWKRSADPAPDFDPEVDAAMTSSLPAGQPDADSWVAQWASLFEDDPDPAPALDPDHDPDDQTHARSGTEVGSSTKEMPVYQAEQPPVSDPDPGGRGGSGPQPEVIPGHLGPRGPGQIKPGRDSVEAEMAAWEKSQERSKRRAKLRANQRKARVIQRNRPAPDEIGSQDPASFRSSLASSPNRRAAILTGALVLAGAMALIGYLLTGIGQSSEDDTVATGTNGISPAGQSLDVGADVESVNVQDLALSTVQLIGLDRSLEPQCAGSGVIVDPAGLILTNAHVITTQGGCRFNSIGVARTVDSSSAAELRYRAEVLVVDEGLDLAVVKIVGWLDPSRSEALPDAFPTAPLGDSDSVGLGDGVRILGYPAIGGETITLTTGSVSGFSSQVGVGSRALIKTDATISAGNSGGMAVDSTGRVIGIPTKAQATESGPAIDCRPVSDTNGDGTVDDNDACVSVGGFLNGIRPINLARPILSAAPSAEPIGAVAFPAGGRSDLDFDLIEVGNPRFTLGESDGRPGGVISTAQAGIEQLCFFFDWRGIPQGTRWDSAWFIDGVPRQDTQQQRDPWNYDESGTDLWFCVEEEGDVGLPAGIYEIGFFLESDVVFAEGIVLTSDPVDVVPVTWSNDTGVELCGLAVNPLSDSGQVGMNELDRAETIPPGESTTIELPLGRYVVEAYNCEGEAVADNYAGLPVGGPVTFLVGIGPSE